MESELKIHELEYIEKAAVLARAPRCAAIPRLLGSHAAKTGKVFASTSGLACLGFSLELNVAVFRAYKRKTKMNRRSFYFSLSLFVPLFFFILTSFSCTFFFF